MICRAFLNPGPANVFALPRGCYIVAQASRKPAIPTRQLAPCGDDNPWPVTSSYKSSVPELSKWFLQTPVLGPCENKSSPLERPSSLTAPDACLQNLCLAALGLWRRCDQQHLVNGRRRVSCQTPSPESCKCLSICA